jgi:hypothetical protein
MFFISSPYVSSNNLPSAFSYCIIFILTIAQLGVAEDDKKAKSPRRSKGSEKNLTSPRDKGKVSRFTLL